MVHTGKPPATCDYHKTLAQPRSRTIVESLMGLTVNRQKRLYFTISCQKCNVMLLRFSKTHKFWSSKARWRLHFSLLSIILADLSGNRCLILKGSKGHGLWFLIGGLWCLLCVFGFQDSLLVIIIMIGGSKKCNNCEGGFWTSEFRCFWKAQ